MIQHRMFECCNGEAVQARSMSLFSLVDGRIPAFSDAKLSPWKAGAVFTKGTDKKVVAMDFSRGGMHPVEYIITRYPREATGCEIYMSRPPCAKCTKMIAQARIGRVYHLPFQPECIDEEDIRSVQHHFHVRSMSLTEKIPNVLNALLRPKSRFSKPTVDYSEPFTIFDKEDYKFWKYGGCPNQDSHQESHNSKNVLYLSSAKIWLEKITYRHIPDKLVINDLKAQNGCKVVTDFRRDFILHTMRMAELCSVRGEDVASVVGAVIVKPTDFSNPFLTSRYIGFGWNGYPCNRESMDYPVGKEGQLHDTKYPYILHAEFSALFYRNCDDVNGAIVFSTKTPCDDCLPMLKEMGINTFVVPQEKTRDGRITYHLFKKTILDGDMQIYTIGPSEQTD